MTCERFRARFAPATDDPAVLAHLRSCDACRAFAVEGDPDVMVRALGGDDMIPAGGVDTFVADVMREVRLRKTETAAKHQTPWARRFAIAATVAMAITAASSVYFNGRSPAREPMAIARANMPQTFASRPSVEMYESESATIVEVPAGASEDVKVVMVFDESLPADL